MKLQFVKGVIYTYDEIESFSSDDNQLEDHGPYTVGKNFLSIDLGNNTFSFVLTGTRGQDSIYECIFAE
jgi:hypothetical protein